MNLTQTPVITKMTVVPVAGYDSMLMAERNAVNMGFREYSITFCADAEEAGRTA